MIQIDDKLISLDVFEQPFACDLSKCKGACCVHGDSGAPLDETEVEAIEKAWPFVKSYLREESIKSIQEQGFSVVDDDGDIVTPLLNGEECAYAIFEDGIALCAIEKAFFANQITFRKPLSCHLYPIRLGKLRDGTAVNYHHWHICESARQNGKLLGTKVYEFAADALKRKFGDAWYEELNHSAHWYFKEYREYKENK
jgi:hypothetical protein